MLASVAPCGATVPGRAHAPPNAAFLPLSHSGSSNQSRREPNPTLPVTTPNLRDDDRIAFFALGTAILRHRHTIVNWTVVVAVIFVVPVLFKQREYAASASFLPQGGDSRQTGLASLAGQFGVTLPGANQAQSADFYASLLKSRDQLRLIARDTFEVAEMQGRRIPLMELLTLQPRSPIAREEEAILLLGEMIGVSVAKPQGIVELTAVTRWPSVSYAIADAMVRNVDNFNRKTRQSQASSERRFLEQRIALSRAELNAAEDKLREFYIQNKVITGSYELQLQRDRLQRDVVLQQQVFTSLSQAYEDARIREVRDTPVITVIDAPTLPTMARPRGRLARGMAGLLVGALAGLLWVYLSLSFALKRKSGDPDATEFMSALGEFVGTLLRPISWLRSRFRT